MHVHTCWPAALHDRAAIQAIIPAIVAEQVVGDALRSRALSPDHHPAGIPSEGGDVFLDPPQGEPLVHEASVAGPLGHQAGSLQKPPHPQSIVHIHGNDRLAQILAHFDDAAEVVLGIGRRAGIEPTAINPNQDGQVGVVSGRADDVQCETVLGDGEGRVVLHAAVAVLRCIPGVVKRGVDALGPSEAQIPQGRLGIGYT